MKKRFADQTTVGGSGTSTGKKGTVSIFIGATILVLFLIGAFIGSYGHELGWYPHNPNETKYDEFDLPPSSSVLSRLLDRREVYEYDLFDVREIESRYLLGTDNDGRDIFIRVLSGASTYLWAGVLTVSLALIIGIGLGAISGYYKQKISETIASFILNVLDSYPRIVLLIIAAFVSNFNLYAIMITLGVLNSTRIARIVASTTLSLKNSDFILAAKEIGLSDRVIILKHIVWYNCRYVLFVQIIYGFASVILVEATLSYIGYGVGEPLVSWGRMIYEGAGGRYPFNFVAGIYWQAIPPAVAIVATILGLNLLGDGLSKRYNVKDIEYV